MQKFQCNWRNMMMTIPLLYLLNPIAQANPFGWHFFNKAQSATHNSDINAAFHERLPLMFRDDITEDQDIKKLKLTPVQKHQALVWQLTTQQEKRYVLLMRNRSHLYYAKRPLSPVEILGLNARTDQERQYYASLAAEQAFTHTAKLLAFNAAYHQAALALKAQLRLPIIRSFNYAPYSPYHYEPLHVQAYDRLQLFLKKSDDVKPIMTYLMTQLTAMPSVTLTVYFIDKAISKIAMHRWAKTQNISTHLEAQISLQHADRHDQKTPQLILIRAGKTRVIDTSRF